MQITVQSDVELLKKRVLALESQAEGEACAHVPESYEKTFSAMQDKIDDLENRSRRVLFFGIDDTEEAETWKTSEQLVRELCSDKLEITVNTIARAHRLGAFSTDKKRPIIAKFLNEKEVESILSKGIKLKKHHS